MKKINKPKKTAVRKYRENNANLFNETYTEKQKRLKREEEFRLDRIVTKRAFTKVDGEIINDYVDADLFEVIEED